MHTNTPEGISRNHLLELGKKSGLIGSYRTVEMLDAIEGYARVVLADKAVQEAFVAANQHLLKVGAGGTACPSDEEIEGCSGCKSLVKQWARECDDTDELLAMLGISATVARTEGGSLHIGKLRELICTFQAAGQMYEAAIEEMGETLRIARECLDNNELALCAGAIDAAMKVGADKTANAKVEAQAR